jgi:hypothetical protein
MISDDELWREKLTTKRDNIPLSPFVIFVPSVAKKEVWRNWGETEVYPGEIPSCGQIHRYSEEYKLIKLIL